MKCEAAAAILASEGPAPVSVGRQHAPSSCDFAQHVSPCAPPQRFHGQQLKLPASAPGRSFVVSANFVGKKKAKKVD